MWRRRYIGGLAFLVGAALAACDDGPVDEVGSVVVSPAEQTTMQQDTARFTVVVRNPGGRELTDRTVTWTASDSTIAEHIGNGRFIARARGEATITAEVEGKTDTALMTVTHRPIVDLEFMFRSADGEVGDSVQLFATAYDSRGMEVFGAPINWGSRDPSVATVTSEGLVRMVSVGSTQIVAGVPGTGGLAADSARIDVRFPYAGRAEGSFRIVLESRDLGKRTLNWEADAVFLQQLGGFGGSSSAIIVAEPPGWEQDTLAAYPDSLLLFHFTQSLGTGVQREFDAYNPNTLGLRDPTELRIPTATFLVKMPNGDVRAYVARHPGYLTVREGVVPPRPGLVIGDIAGDVHIYKAVGWELIRDADGNTLAYLTGDTASIHAGFRVPYMHWPIAGVDVQLTGVPLPLSGVLAEPEGMAFRLGPVYEDTVITGDPPQELIRPYRAHYMEMTGRLGTEEEPQPVYLAAYMRRALAAISTEPEDFEPTDIDVPENWGAAFAFLRYTRDEGDIIGGSRAEGNLLITQVIEPLDLMFGEIRGEIAASVDISISSGVPGQFVTVTGAAAGAVGARFALPTYWVDLDEQLSVVPATMRLRGNTLRELQNQILDMTRRLRR